ncbi:type IV secretion protein Rhs [Streptomyces sp. 150FB]|uniref:VgrG-related protein n=1 Tax=Streptomyces sp. 150FB TaxID=1576605 RepID=UPI000589541B|nr:VgrG-related protein [Streptomyces sp. 150FB]KIF75166.1 type IV secretion protein Rhs [Streptomyces sp. 150FB]
MSQVSYSNIFHVTFDGRKLTDDIAPLLTSGWVDFGAGVPGSFQLDFRDPDRLVLAKANIKIGTKVMLAPVAASQGAQFPLLTGEVTGLESDYDGTGSFTVVRGYDLGHRMLRQRRVTAYRNMTASDIARQLAGKDKVPIGSIGRTTTVYEFITQANVTDWDFLSRLADENEMVMSLNARGKFTFVKRDPASGAPASSALVNTSPQVLARENIRRCRAAVTSADQVSQVRARGWDVTTKKALVGQSPAATSPAIAIGTSPAKAVTAFGTATLVETDTPYDKQGEVKNAASALADDVTASFAELEVTATGNPKLRPGVPVSLSGIGDPFEGKYTVTGARHSFGSGGGGYETFLTVSGRQWRSLYGLTSGGAGGMPRLPSVANALVTDIKDPLRQGRVKLRFPWLDDTYVSDWTRTVQAGGVKGGGLIGLDVDDEVLVTFDRGALDHPFVIGGLYNGRDKPGVVDVQPYDATSGKTVRRTLADRSGNRLDLLDQRTGGKQGVRLNTGDNRLTINLDRTKTEITIDSKGSVTISGTRKVSVEAADISLDARAKLSINSGGTLSITGKAVSVKAAAALSLTGLETTVTGTTMLNLDSAMALNLKSLNIQLAGIIKMLGEATLDGLQVMVIP